MENCARLFRADNFNAYYEPIQKLVVVTADVMMGLGDVVHICPNPLSRIIPAPEYRELMVEGRTKPGIHPAIVHKRTLMYSYHSDQTPAKVRVFSMGVDNPVSTDVAVGDQAPVIADDTSAAQQGTAGTAAEGPPYEATGWSEEFKLDEAYARAITELRKITPVGNPDLPLMARVVEIGSASGGFSPQHGLYVKVAAKL